MTTHKTAGRLGMLLLLTALGLAALAGAASAATQAGAEEQLIADVNRERTALGLPALTVDVQLTRVARDWSRVMAAEDRMYHNQALGEQVRGDWTRLGENVGYTMKTDAAPQELVGRLHAAFMGSPGHKANILGDYSTVGVGTVIAPDGKMWVTVNFAMASVTTTGAVDEAVNVSRQVFPSDDSAEAVVLARHDVFADALAGAGLAGGRAPVLFTPGPGDTDSDPVMHSRSRAELDRVLPEGGTVYLLGGGQAVSGQVERELAADGYQVRRLAGASRIETSIRIAEELLATQPGRATQVLLARGDNWVDAISGGAYAAASGNPVVLSPSDELTPSLTEFLNRNPELERIALGGAAALSDRVVEETGARRVAGNDRTSTAAAVAEQLWGRTRGGAGDQYAAIPGFSGDGWAYALAYAPWSAQHGAPQLLVGDTVSPALEGYLGRLGYGGGVQGEVVASSPVPGPVVDRLRALVDG